VQLSERIGAYQVTVFTAPVPLRAGPIDVSVLVQDPRGEPMPEAEVTIEVERLGKFPATHDAATNKLYHSAKFELPAPGLWRMEVRIAGEQGEARKSFEVVVGDPLPRWAEMWFWIAFPVVPILLFALYQALRRTGQRGRSSSAHPDLPGT